MPRTTRDPSKQIEEGNCWYTDDQFAVQLGTPSSKFVVENRWRIFSEAIDRWIQRNQTDRGKQTIHILDAGCGDGINLFGLHQALKKHSWDIQLFGIDYNPLRVTRAQELDGVAGLLQGSLSCLPFSSETFDIILCNQVLEHIYDDLAALQEVNRILRQDGILILGVPNEGCLLGRLRNQVFQPSILKTTDHFNFYSEKSLTEILEKAGFDIQRIEREGFFNPHFKLHGFLLNKSWGRRLVCNLGKLIPSQAAGIFAIALRRGLK